MKYRFLALLFCLFTLTCNGQSPEISISAKLDSSHIVIGDHLKLHLTITAPSQKKLSFADTKNWQLINCEAIEASPLNQTSQSPKSIYNQTITLTSFDAGEALILPISVFESDTLMIGKSDTISFRVDTLPVFVDTAKAFKDIKPPMDGKRIPIIDKNDLDNSGLSKLQKTLLIIAGVLIALAIAAFFLWKHIKKYLEQKRLIAEKARLKDNAGQFALNRLKQLKMKKLWQNGHVKEYYSELSIILRTYINHQWDINAMEMVTSEIMDSITSLDITDEQMHDLNSIFSMSDLAKFAKCQPIAEDNDINYKNAWRFVQSSDSNEKRKKMEEEKSQRFVKNHSKNK